MAVALIFFFTAPARTRLAVALAAAGAGQGVKIRVAKPTKKEPPACRLRYRQNRTVEKKEIKIFAAARRRQRAHRGRRVGAQRAHSERVVRGTIRLEPFYLRSASWVVKSSLIKIL